MSDKGIIHDIKNNAPVIEYNPEKFWKENTIESIFKDLSDHAEKERKWKQETGWKQDYFITVGEAETASFEHLEWLCNTYRVIGGSEAVSIIRQRELTKK